MFTVAAAAVRNKADLNGQDGGNNLKRMLKLIIILLISKKAW